MSAQKDDRLVNRLSALCQARGITYYRLSKQIGVAPSTLSQIGNGQRAASPAVLVALCDALQCEVGDLLYVEPPSDLS